MDMIALVYCAVVAGAAPLGSDAAAGSTVMAEPVAVADEAPQAAALEDLETRIVALEEARRIGDSVTAGEKGFAIRSADGAWRLGLRGVLQLDTREYLGRCAPVFVDTFFLKQARMVWDVQGYDRVSLKFVPDFGNGKAVIIDAYAEGRLRPELRVKAGKSKPPIALERLQGDAVVAFTERGVTQILTPSRDIGYSLLGTVGGGLLSYEAGIYNGAADGDSPDADTAERKEFAGRIFAHPLRALGVRALNALGVGVGGSIGDRVGSTAAPGVASYKTPAQQTMFSYRSTVLADGEQARVAPQGYWYAGPAWVLGEFVRSVQRVRVGSSRATLTAGGWQAAGGVVVTGEAASYDGLAPAGRCGAVEVAGRFGQVEFDSKAFPVYADPAASVRAIRSWGADVNWWVRRAVRLSVEYDDTKFLGGATRGRRTREQAVLTRVQVIL